MRDLSSPLYFGPIKNAAQNKQDDTTGLRKRVYANESRLKLDETRTYFQINLNVCVGGTFFVVNNILAFIFFKYLV